MKIEYISPADLIPYSKNAKRHPSEQVKLIANSIKEFGFQQPIVVNKDNIVIIGHGRLLASKRLKLAEVPITRVENLTEDQIKALRLADNSVAESEWNIDLLTEEIADIDIDMSDFGKWYVNSRSDKKYCSTNCASRDRGHVALKCTYCGAEFIRYKGDVKGRKAFCNLDCLRAYEAIRKVQRICQQCGKPFEVFKSAIEHTNASGNYCSRECYDKFLGAQEHGKYYRGDFDRVKKEHFSGVQFCAICGTTKNIHIHHIIPYRFTQDNGIDNLIPLCRRHHKMVEEACLHFINLMDDKETAKKYVNIIFRSIQQQTGGILWRLKNSKLSTSN